MSQSRTEALTEYLREFVSEHKQNLLEEVMANRTRYITLVLEDIFQPHNASAVIRSCDCFGVQDLHVIENRNEYDVNPQVTQGSSKWIDLIQHNEGENNTEECLNHLKEQGYTLVATTPNEEATSLYDYKLKGKTAFLFGTELTGLSEKALRLADDSVRIPMYGFSESFNISVSAALLLQHVRLQLETEELDFRLSEEEVNKLRVEWYCRVIKNSEAYLNDFNEKWAG